MTAKHIHYVRPFVWPVLLTVGFVLVERWFVFVTSPLSQAHEIFTHGITELAYITIPLLSFGAFQFFRELSDDTKTKARLSFVEILTCIICLLFLITFSHIYDGSTDPGPNPATQHVYVILTITFIFDIIASYFRVLYYI